MSDILPLGKSNLDNAQPLKDKDLCIAHNGTIANVEELSNMVGGCTFRFSDNDRYSAGSTKIDDASSKRMII